MGNPDIFIFGYVVPLPAQGIEEVWCPQCYAAWHEGYTPEHRVLRSEDMYSFPDGVKCCKCEDYIFVPSYPHGKEVAGDWRLEVYRPFIETLEF